MNAWHLPRSVITISFVLSIVIATIGALTLGSSGSGARANVHSADRVVDLTAIGHAAGIRRCWSSQLLVERERFGVGLGSVAGTVSFKNDSSSSCTLQGYPALQMLDSARQPIATDVIESRSIVGPSATERSVVLAPGALASFYLGYAASTGYGTGTCPASAYVKITPPNWGQPITIAWRIEPYGGSTIATLHCGEITVSPVFKGTKAPSS